MRYGDSISVRHARDEYFRENNFGADGGYGDRWVKIKVGPFPVWFPNTTGRRRAVRLHDLHHIATGYNTSVIGEAEIGAWELAAGCADYYAAWFLNACGVVIGLFLSPRRVWQAYLRGRSSLSLYHVGFDDRQFEGTVGELRTRLGLATPGER